MDRKAGKLVVEGVNRVYKHVRRSQKNPQGGRLSKEMPIQLSATCCWSARRAARPPAPGARLLPDGGKERYCKKCGAATARSAATGPETPGMTETSVRAAIR